MQLDQKALIEEAVQASIDAGLAVNGEYGVAAARHAARFMFNTLQAVQPVPVVSEKERWQAWARKRLEIQSKHWLRAANAALNGDMRELRNRVELSEAEPVDVVLSAERHATASAEPVAYTSQAQLDRLAEGKGGIIWSEPLPYHDDIALYAAAISGGDNAK